jgi:cysteine desulfurase
VSARRVYLDFAATTPIDPAVLAAMVEQYATGPYNPSSLHAEGREAHAALDEARESVARSLGVKAREIVFTSGGSEADNLAIFGTARARRERGRHVVTCAIEHEAVLRACERLREDGYDVTILPVDGEGRVELARFERALRDDTVLATIALANNEIGTLQAVPELAALARARGVRFHTDAVQAPGRVPLDARSLGVDLLSLAAHKFHGPKGVGVLYVREGTELAPQVLGGSQEAARRAGTENVAGITGLARALELAVAHQAERAARLAHLRDGFEAGLRARFPGVRLNGAGAPRLPNISNFALEGLDAPTLLIALDLAGFAVSVGSACAAGSSEPSHVIAALGAPSWVARGAIRVSLGAATESADLKSFLDALGGICRSAAPAALLEKETA